MTPAGRALVLALLLAGCKGNVNDDSPLIPSTIRVSVAYGGGDPLAASYHPAFAAGGRYIAFDSDAANLVPGDTNAFTDVFVYDVVTQIIERVSVDSAGVQGGKSSSSPAISADGRFVAFESNAGLVGGDGNSQTDIYVRDRGTNTTTRASVLFGGGEIAGASTQASISDDGQVVAFITTMGADTVAAGAPADANGATDVFVRVGIATTELVSINAGGTATGNGQSFNPRVSADGSCVVFTSTVSAGTLDATAPVTDSLGSQDIFLRRRVAPISTKAISLRYDGAAMANPSRFACVSGDGSFVAFQSDASGLLPPGEDSNGATDVYVCTVATMTMELVSRNSLGVQGSYSSDSAAISSDGRFVTFASAAGNLAPEDGNGLPDIFIRDRHLGTTERVSVRTFGGDANGASFVSGVSADGRYVAFSSGAENLDDGDHNTQPDIFLRGPLR